MVISSIYRILEMKNMTIMIKTMASAVIMIATRDVMVMMMILLISTFYGLMAE